MRFFLPIILCIIRFDEGIELLGLFPKYVRNDSSELYVKHGRVDSTHDDVWSDHCLAMFRAAISLANEYKVLIDGEKISSSVIRTNNDENGIVVLNLVCSYITSHRPNIVGIIGPASSSATRFVAPFAALTKLPIISYAATNADFSDVHDYSTFYRTIPSDLLLARAIVELFEIFKWKTCTMIYQKDDYGYGALGILTESYYQNLTIKERLAFDGQKFHADLKETLDRSQSRIVLVWADDEKTTSIVKQALQLGLLGAPYVWITTDEVSLSTFTSNKSEENEYWEKLEGLLSIIPAEGDGSNQQDPIKINKPLFKEALAAWSHSSSKEDVDVYPYRAEHNISPFAMFAFDATWTLIQALNKTSFDDQSASPWFVSSSYCFNSSLQNETAYHQYLKATKFLGISGRVTFSGNLSNDRTDGAYYVLKNIQRNVKQQLRYEHVMMYHEKTEDDRQHWQNITGRYIVWPSLSKEIPTDHPQIRGHMLRICVIESSPFVTFWNKSSMMQKPLNVEMVDTEDENMKMYGYVADFIVQLQNKMHFQLKINANRANTSYNTLVESVSLSNNTCDLAVSDITITSNRLRTVDFSLPIYENSVRIVIRDNPSFSVSFFSFLRPFSPQVWLCILGLIFYSSLLIYVFERKQMAENKQKQVFRMVLIEVYHTLSSIVGVGTDVQWRTTSSRIMAIALFSLSVILVATYTANLSSFLTFQRSQSSISGIDDIKNGRLPFQRVGVVNDSATVDYYTQNVSTIYYPLQSTKDIYTYLLDNRIDAALGDATTLEYIVDRQYCGRLLVVGVGFAKSSFGIAMRKNWQYKDDLDLGILSLRESAVLESLEQKWFFKRTCNEDHKTVWENDGIPLTIMSGLFYTFLIVSAIALALHLSSYRTTIIENFKSKTAIIALLIKFELPRRSKTRST